MLARCVAAAALLAAASARADTVDRVRAAGALACGVVTEETDYDKADVHGGLDDLGGEICKAVAVAVLGDAARLKLSGFPAEQGAAQALHRGGVDLVVGLTPSASLGWQYQVRFGPPVFYDALGFMVHAASGIRTLADLAGKSVCFIEGTETDRRLVAALHARRIPALLVAQQEEGEMDAMLVVGRCDAIAADLSKLAESRAAFHGAVGDFVMLPDLLSLDPVAPAYDSGDLRWAMIVDWTVYALIQAEISGVTRANVSEWRGGDDPTIERLLGEDFSAARALGLDRNWAARVIAAVGNYGEIYRRTAGEQSDLRLPRGLNVPWTEGGLLRPLPVR